MTAPEHEYPPGDGAKPRVLIVDGHASSSLVMKLVLRMHGFPCAAVTSEALAIAAIEVFRPDVVILEWASRLERNVEQAARIRGRARARGHSVAIVVVTQELVRPCAEVLREVDGYFTKPVVLENLEQAILRLAEPVRGAQDAG